MPIYKKKRDKTDCRNYRGITLLSIPGKIFTKILQKRLQTYVEMTISEEQAGFRPGRSTIDQLFTIRQVTEKYIEGNQTCYINFIDYKQAFDSVWRQGLWQSMRNAGISETLIKLIQAIYQKADGAVKKDKQLTDWFKTEVGTRQGCTLSPYLFLIIIEVIFNLACKDIETGVQCGGKTLNNLKYADDVSLIATKVEDLQKITDIVNDHSEKLD